MKTPSPLTNMNSIEMEVYEDNNENKEKELSRSNLSNCVEMVSTCMILINIFSIV